MEKEISILLKMLNGTLSKAPAFLRHTIVQYQWQQSIEGLMYLIGAVIIGIIVLKTVRFIIQRTNDKDYKVLDDSFFFVFCLPMILCGLVMCAAYCFKTGINDIGHAISPVTSLIQTLHTI